MTSSGSPYQYIGRGQMIITPPTSVVSAVPTQVQSLEKPREFSLWVNGRIQDPAMHLDHARMPPSLYQEVRDDLVRFSPVEVTRSAFRKADHSYIGVIDSKGVPYYFALDGRGISVREAKIDDERVWKTFNKLSDHEHAAAAAKRRVEATVEVDQLAAELQRPMLFLMKSETGVDDWRFAHKRKAARRSLTRRRLLAKAEAHTGTMVALYLPKDAADRVAIPGGEKPEDLHITLAYLGKDLTNAQKDLVIGAVQRFAQRTAPIRATLGGVGRFSASSTSDGKDVIYASVDSPDITRLRDALLAELAAESISPNTVHGFVPHVTLSYVDTSAPSPITRFEPTEVVFTYAFVRAGQSAYCVSFKQEQPMLHYIAKALPKKSKESSVKKTPTKKAASKKAGSGGKTRYSYPNEKKKPSAGSAKKPGQQVPLIIQHDDSKHADPVELANQLGVSVRTLKRTADRLGRDGFVTFMRARLKRFSAKHRLDPDYWSTLFTRIVSSSQPAL